MDNKNKSVSEIVGLLKVVAILVTFIIALFIVFKYTSQSSNENKVQEEAINELPTEIVNDGYNFHLIKIKSFTGDASLWYDEDTKVIYYIHYGVSGSYGITPVYNADGSLKLYEE